MTGAVTALGIELPAVLQALRDSHPGAAQLALLACLPVRVTPAFLRLARLRLLPEGSTGDEADLWLSDLVETRSAAGFSFRREVRDALRTLLPPPLLDALWHRVHLEHAPWLTPRARLEEELTWRLLRDRSDGWIEAQWRSVLQELDAGPNADGVARWVVRAVPDLPEGTLDHASGRRAYYGAHLLLGDASVLGSEAQSFLASSDFASDFAFATRRLPRRRIFVGLTDEGLLISPLREIQNGHEIDLPATRPLWLQIEDPEQQLPAEVVIVADNQPAHLPWQGRALTLRLIDGSAYALRSPMSANEADDPAASQRQPRVEIFYDVEVDGQKKPVQLPFVTGVLADLSGLRDTVAAPMEERKFIQIDGDNFADVMSRLRPRLAFQVPNVLIGDASLAVDLVFSSLEKFTPDWMLVSLPALLSAGDALERLRKHHRRMTRPPVMGQTEIVTGSAVESMAKQFGVPLDPKKRGLPTEVERLINIIERRLCDQLDLILHHPHFQRLEGTWRGLHHLVRHSKTNEMLKIRVLDASKAELHGMAKEFGGSDWERSPLFKKIYEEAFGQFGGEPFGCLVGDYAFDHSVQDVALLAALAKIAAAAHAPFIAAAAPALMQMSSWQELASPRDMSRIFGTPEYAGWRALRESEDSRYLALVLPRLLARMPYGANTTPVDGLDFEETISGTDHASYVWANPAYAMAANIHRAFSTYGWCARIAGIESGGAVDGWPLATFPNDDGGVAGRCPSEIAIGMRREAELRNHGLMTVAHRPTSDITAFISAQSLHQPATYDDPDAAANAAHSAQLPYLLTTCRFVHYIKCIARDRVGSFTGREDMQRYLNEWIGQYLDRDPLRLTELGKTRRPLAAAEVVVEDVEGDPGTYGCKVFLRPHYQLEGLTVSLRVATRLPSATVA